ncbi:MAG TPA: NAD(P)H-hydrate dehydratase [Candidatus Limnocylindria bacterium]|nr:NAD(P)H-hydrate dehydratase [Candidatus Limnocylindria bacterium]
MAVIGIERAWVAKQLPPRGPRSHKGTFGRVLAVAGSLEYAGAALLAGLGAARSGAGLVCLATPESLGLRLIGEVPELTMLLLQEEAAGLTGPVGWRRLSTEAAHYEAVVVGPGLGRQPSTLRRTRNLIGELRVPTVVDADGLNALAESDRWWRSVSTQLVLTPHVGEFARLSKGSEMARLADDDRYRIDRARDAAILWGQVVVLKGAHTVVADPDGEVMVSEVATPALSTAGSGDVLAGSIAAFLASGCEPRVAAGLGVAVHGAAGLLAEARIGRAGTMARDIANLLPEAIESLRTDRTR